MNFGSTQWPAIQASRGIPQGSKYGPKLFSALLHSCVQPVWTSCLRDGLGYDCDGKLVPFAFYCDNVFIFAHGPGEFLEIHRRLQLGLARAGWRLPDDRLEWQANKHVAASDLTRLAPFSQKLPGTCFKILGSMANANGTSHADITFKRHICNSALQLRSPLWACRQATRKKNVCLMHLVACSSFSWCVGAWTINRRLLTSLNGVFTRHAKSSLRLPRFRREGDAGYHRRMARELWEKMQEANLARMDAYVLGRLYDYAGHLARAIQANPGHLTGIALDFRDAEWKRTMTEVIGHQGHPGRFSPWRWERQFSSYFQLEGLLWKEVAIDRDEWLSHKMAWTQTIARRT